MAALVPEDLVQICTNSGSIAVFKLFGGGVGGIEHPALFSKLPQLVQKISLGIDL